MNPQELELLRRINADGTVTVIKPGASRGCREMQVLAINHARAKNEQGWGKEFEDCYNQHMDQLLHEMDGWFGHEEPGLHFRDESRYMAWAERYERWDSSIILHTPDSHHNPDCWKNFLGGFPNFVPTDANLRKILDPLDAEMVHDGRFCPQHWRVDFARREDLVAFQLIHG